MPNVSEDFKRMLLGYGRTTAKIYFTFLNRPRFINPNWMVWQFDDLAPEFPRLHDFVKECNQQQDERGELGGRPAIIAITHAKLTSPVEFKVAHGEFRLQ